MPSAVGVLLVGGQGRGPRSPPNLRLRPPAVSRPVHNNASINNPLGLTDHSYRVCALAGRAAVTATDTRPCSLDPDTAQNLVGLGHPHIALPADRQRMDSGVALKWPRAI